jgi:hypothetical protein
MLVALFLLWSCYCFNCSEADESESHRARQVDATTHDAAAHGSTTAAHSVQSLSATQESAHATVTALDGAATASHASSIVEQHGSTTHVGSNTEHTAFAVDATSTAHSGSDTHAANSVAQHDTSSATHAASFGGAHETTAAHEASSHAADEDGVQKKLHDFAASKDVVGKSAKSFNVHATVNTDDAAALTQLVQQLKVALASRTDVRITVVKVGDKTTIAIESEKGSGLDDATASDAASLLAQSDAVDSIVATASVDESLSRSAASVYRSTSSLFSALTTLLAAAMMT